MKKLTETWGERMAREASRLVARHRPHAPALAWLAPFVRRIAALPPPSRFARTEPGAHDVETPGLEEGMPLPADVRDRLRIILGPGVARARIHTGATADAFARAHHADAVTVGDHVLFRDGEYRPHDEQGLALLAHEATHVVEGALPAHRATAAGVAAEEARAHASEHHAQLPGSARFATTAPSSPSSASPSPSPADVAQRPTAALPAAATLAVRPMAADVDRPTVTPATSTTPPLDVAELKRSIYRDLLRQIRSDAERGG